MDDYLNGFRRIRAVPSDEFFCQLVMTESYSHNIAEELSLTDRDRHVSLRNPETVSKIHFFQSQLEFWRLNQVDGLQHCKQHHPG